MNSSAGAVCATLMGALAGSLAQAQADSATTAATDHQQESVRRIVLEDDAVRIEELRVRGRTLRIVVIPKAGGARRYEIEPAEGGRDASQPRSNAGLRQWSVFSF